MSRLELFLLGAPQVKIDKQPLALLVARTRCVQSRFDLAADWTNVIRLCQIVEGMPLGIELAALENGLEAFHFFLDWRGAFQEVATMAQQALTGLSTWPWLPPNNLAMPFLMG